MFGVIGLLMYLVHIGLSALPWHLIEESDLSGEMVSSDVVYTGSLTFAGLVLFGSIMLTRIHTVTIQDPLGRYIGAIMIILGAYLLSLSHMVFAFLYGYIVILLGQQSTLIYMTMWSVSLIAMTVFGFMTFITSPIPREKGDSPTN